MAIAYNYWKTEMWTTELRCLIDAHFNFQSILKLLARPNGSALSCGADNFRNATDETSSRWFFQFCTDL